jgi:hypothetical protein
VLLATSVLPVLVIGMVVVGVIAGVIILVVLLNRPRPPLPPPGRPGA